MYQIPGLLKMPKMAHAFSTADEGNMGNVILGKVMDMTEVLDNRIKFLKKSGADTDKTICIWVEHGDKVVKADPKLSGISLKNWRYAVHCDSISTDTKGLFLFLLIADCLPVIFFDQMKHVVGLMHYGWKNADLNLTKLMVRHLTENYGCISSDLIIGLGPCVRKESYIKKNPTQVNKPEWRGFIEKEDDSLYKVDVVGLCKKQLIDEGVNPENIIDCEIDTSKDSRFFSRTRALKVQKEDLARFACVVGIL